MAAWKPVPADLAATFDAALLPRQTKAPAAKKAATKHDAPR
jgi:hypothetical protein